MVPTFKNQRHIPTSKTRRYQFGWGAGFLLILSLIIAGCASAPVSDPTMPQALAIWTLEDLSLPGTVQPELAELLTAKVMETAEATETYLLVERERLLAVLQELNLGSSQLADEATGLRLGKLVGARLMLFGSYQVVAAQMRIDLRLVDVETGRVINAAEKTVPAGNMVGWLRGAEMATQDLLLP